MLIIVILASCFLHVRSDYDYYKKSKHFTEPSIIEGMNIQYNPSFLNKSVLNFGNLYFNTTLKMSKGECLNILNIGGSISGGGSAQNHHDNPQGSYGAYPTILERYLNSMWPCMRDNQRGTHKVTNWWAGGRPTISWVDEIVGARMGQPEILLQADIILVETSVNDVEEGRDQAVKAREDPVSHLRKVTELFIKILSQIPQGPCIIYVGSSTREKAWRLPQPRTGDSVANHLPVTNYYHVPYVSTIDAIGPFVTDESLHWFSNVFLADTCCHPTKTGRRIIAAVIYNILQLHREAATNDDEYVHSAHINYYDKQAQYASPELINQYAISLPLVIHLNSNDIHKSADKVSVTSDSNWAVYEDRAGKPGFISSTVGSTFQVSISQSAVQTHLKSGLIHVELFKSYEHVGRVKVSIGIRVEQPVPGSTETSSTYHQLSTRVVDCIWADRSSQRAVEEVRLDMNELYTHMPSSPSPPSSDSTTVSTLLLDFEVMASEPARKNNKVKMLGLMLM